MTNNVQYGTVSTAGYVVPSRGSSGIHASISDAWIQKLQCPPGFQMSAMCSKALGSKILKFLI